MTVDGRRSLAGRVEEIVTTTAINCPVIAAGDSRDCNLKEIAVSSRKMDRCFVEPESVYERNHRATLLLIESRPSGSVDCPNVFETRVPSSVSERIVDRQIYYDFAREKRANDFGIRSRSSIAVRMKRKARRFVSISKIAVSSSPRRRRVPSSKGRRRNLDRKKFQRSVDNFTDFLLQFLRASPSVLLPCSRTVPFGTVPLVCTVVTNNHERLTLLRSIVLLPFFVDRVFCDLHAVRSAWNVE